MVEVGRPIGFVVLVTELCRMATLDLPQEGGTLFFSRITASVLQGSPFSGSMFAMVMDALLQALGRAAWPRKGLLRACADDVASVLCHMAMVGVLAPIVSDTQRACGLSLHRRKGVVGMAPWIASAAASPRSCAGARRSGATTTSALAGDVQWGAPVTKWRQRCRDVALVAMTVQATAAACRSRALPILTCAAELAEAPALRRT